MKESKEKNTLPVVLDDTDIEINSMEKELSEKFNAKFVKILKRLAYEIAVVGLSEEEACMIVGYGFDELKVFKAKNPIVDRLFKMKNLEYKRGMLKTLSEKARNGDDKLAQWLLEVKDPETFNRRKGVGGGGEEGNTLGGVIEFIRESNNNGVVKREAGRAFITNNGPIGAVPNISDMLKGRAAEVIAKIDKDNGRE